MPFYCDIVTVYNDVAQYNRMVDSLRESNQLQKCRLIGIDNTGNTGFSSAAAAYNYAIKGKISSEVVIFCHQDILFGNGAIDQIYYFCKQNQNVLYGAAGCLRKENSDDGNLIVSCLRTYDARYGTLKEDEEKDVFTLDECLIAGNIELFRKVKFNEQLCDGWHFYAVELALRCHTLNIPVKVFGVDITHLSNGKPNESFYQCERKIANYYRKFFKLINYSWGWCYTDPVKYELQFLYRKIRHHI